MFPRHCCGYSEGFMKNTNLYLAGSWPQLQSLRPLSPLKTHPVISRLPKYFYTGLGMGVAGRVTSSGRTNCSSPPQHQLSQPRCCLLFPQEVSPLGTSDAVFPGAPSLECYVQSHSHLEIQRKLTALSASFLMLGHT